MSILIEQNVLGAVLMGGLPVFDEITSIVKPEMFAKHEHKYIYEIISEAANDNTEIDVITIANACDKDIAGIMYLGELVKGCYTSDNAILYAKSLRDEFIKRNMIKGIAELQSRLINETSCTKSVQMLMDFTDSISQNIETDRKPRLIKEVLHEVIDDIEKAFNANGEIIGLTTGFRNIDYMLNGLEKGRVMIVAGRPGSGKSTLAFNIAENVALDDKSVLVFNLEMSAAEVGKKNICSIGGLSSRKIKTGMMADSDFGKVTHAVGLISDKKLIIDDKPNISINEMKTRARQVKREHGLDLIVIDYIQLMEGKGNNRTEEIGHISRNIKLMAKELEVPVIALSQLSRNLESRNNKRPMLSDLRESGAIEQDADIVSFIYREEYYEPETPNKNLAEINIAKQRDGETGVVLLETNLAQSKFMDTTRTPG